MHTQIGLSKKYNVFGIPLFLLFFTLPFTSQIGCLQEAKTPPVALRENIKDVLHGVEVYDPYRWLEDWSDPQVKQWSDAQNGHTRSILTNLPALAEIRRDVTMIMSDASVSYSDLSSQAGQIFAMKSQPPLNQSLLITMPSAHEPSSERVIINLNQMDATGATSIDWYVPSPDGQLVAVSLSIGGSERGDLHIYEVSTGELVGDIIEGVNGGTAGGDAAWLADGSGFYYTRYPRTGERPDHELNFYQQVWLHKLGTSSANDTYVLGKEFPKIAEIRLVSDHSTGRLLAVVQYGDSGRFMHFILEPDKGRQQITTYDDQVVELHLGPNNNMFLISRHNAPRGKILRLSLDAPGLENAVTIVDEGEDTIESGFYSSTKMVITNTKLYVSYQMGGPSEIRVFDHDGKPQPGPQVLPVSSIRQVVSLDNDEILYQNISYIEPAAWYHFDPVLASTKKSALAENSPVDFTDTEVVREFATSKDGTRIPINILRRKGTKLNGSNPVLLTGYGGYGLSNGPEFSALNQIWLAQGGVFAVANIRGGGEYGEEWHRAGMLTNKQNCFDDFAAAMQHMISTGYTNPEKLTIKGGSNGGLLMGAMITQQPGLFKATVSLVGVYDMIRVELSPNGSFNIPEYGTVENPEHFKALLAYSPYHNVKEGVAYPATLLMTGANDPRVDPMHSRKFAAQLQASTTSSCPILLRTSLKTGHGRDTPLDEKINKNVDMYAFLFNELEIEYKAQTTKSSESNQ